MNREGEGVAIARPVDDEGVRGPETVENDADNELAIFERDVWDEKSSSISRAKTGDLDLVETDGA